MQLMQNSLVLYVFHAKGQTSCVSNKYSFSQQFPEKIIILKGDIKQAYL